MSIYIFGVVLIISISISSYNITISVFTIKKNHAVHQPFVKLMDLKIDWFFYG